MNHYILRSILPLFEESVTQSMATKLAERHANVINALERIIPTILRGFFTRLQEGPENAHALLQMAGDAPNGKNLLRMSDEDIMEKGHNMLQQLFGVYNIDNIGKQIAQMTQVRISSAVKLMQLVTPLCIGVIRKFAVEKHYDTNKLADWLSTESFEIVDEGIPGAKAYYNNTVKVITTSGRKTKDRSWIHFGILLLCGGILYWILNR